MSNVASQDVTRLRSGCTNLS